MGKIMVFDKDKNLKPYIKKDESVKLDLYFDDSLYYKESVLIDNNGFFAHQVSAYPGI